MKNKAVRKYLSCILASAMVAGMMQSAAAQEPDFDLIVETEDAANKNNGEAVLGGDIVPRISN